MRRCLPLFALCLLRCGLAAPAPTLSLVCDEEPKAAGLELDRAGLSPHNLRMIALAPDHVHAPEALLTIASCQVEAKETKAARKTLEDIIATYPTTDAANAAKDRLGRMK